MGDDTARKLERGMGKGKGWMDVSHDGAASARDRDIVQGLRLLTEEQRALIEAQVAEFGRLNQAGRDPQSGPEPAGSPLQH